VLIAVLALLAAAGCVNASDHSATVDAAVRASSGDTVSANGSIQVPQGAKCGDITTVNGSIHVGDDAAVSAAHTVNGDIRVGAHATADSLNTVNGCITLGSSARVNAAVGSVNGEIVLATAQVAGGIQTVNGDVDVRGNAHVEGGILVRRPAIRFFLWESSGPRIVIGPGASVAGSLRFEREVRLYVSERAAIGPVTGATPIRFAGEYPSD